MITADQKALKIFAKAREDIQDLRKRMDNRIGRKANGEEQNLMEGRDIPIDDYINFKKIADFYHKQERDIEKMIANSLKKHKVWNEYLSKIQGVGPIAAGWLIGCIDIEKAVNASKITQYCGFNPDDVRGKKIIIPDEYHPSMGEIVKVNYDGRTGKEKAYIIQTDDMVKGDKLTPGYVSPYNGNLKTVLVGVLFNSINKLNGKPDKNGKPRGLSPYRVIYDNEKHRLQNSEVPTPHKNKGQKIAKKIPWKDVTDGHRHSAARRKALKVFLQDLYANWREIEGLYVRPSYAEEYLGRKHVA